jgi:hypothetical protein
MLELFFKFNAIIKETKNVRSNNYYHKCNIPTDVANSN